MPSHCVAGPHCCKQHLCYLQQHLLWTGGTTTDNLDYVRLSMVQHPVASLAMNVVVCWQVGTFPQAFSSLPPRLQVCVYVIIESFAPPTDSGQLQLDDGDEKVRAVPEKRCVLILREIPKDTPKEVTALKSQLHCSFTNLPV